MRKMSVFISVNPRATHLVTRMGLYRFDLDVCQAAYSMDRE
jgi:hypothetical protein